MEPRTPLGGDVSLLLDRIPAQSARQGAEAPTLEISLEFQWKQLHRKQAHLEASGSRKRWATAGPAG